MIEDNVRVAEHVKEFVYVRDGMDEWLLEKGEINDIINYLCTDKCVYVVYIFIFLTVSFTRIKY